MAFLVLQVLQPQLDRLHGVIPPDIQLLPIKLIRLKEVAPRVGHLTRKG